MSASRALPRTAVLARRLAAQPGGIGILARRYYHTRRRPLTAAEVLEGAGGPSTSEDGGSSAMTRRLEEAIDGAMARMSEPDWAPFRPGTSYYAPPRPAGAALGLLALVKQARRMDPMPPRALSGDEARAVDYASRGYPCSTYFIDGHFPDEVERSIQDAIPAENE
ncbi:hypothetical protein E2562_032547 [Oryza meyeriana var. granulata]|uniref:Uncharacterized protein n=1 Tax=Oryza meyeriana var. granulata TaxID=110450 RepID=A0A6G1CUM6_9ORYZ|nr:hypothetical protein E2562_032547 [Oryza meyeriana var. granulata]